MTNTYNMSQLTLQTAIEEVTRIAELEDGKHYFYLKCIDGLFDVSVDVKDSKPIIYHADALPGWKFVGYSYMDNNGAIIYDEEAMPVSRYKLMVENLGKFDNYLSVEDLDQINYSK